MARNVTLTAITEDVRQRLDLDSFSADTHVTSTAVTRMINTSLQSLYSLLMRSWGEGYFTTSDTITTTADIATTSLPSDFVKLIALYWVRGTNDIVPIQEASHDLRIMTQWSSRAWELPRYRLRHSTLQWVPKPNSAYTVALEYVYSPADLSAGSDTFDAGPGWDEWVVLDVCRKIREKSEKDPTEFLAERARVESNILAVSPYRSETSNHIIRDVESGYEYDDRPRWRP
jgi:hypothetical protein